MCALAVLAPAVPARGFAAPRSSASALAHRVALPSSRHASALCSPRMSVPDIVVSFVEAAADVADDFDINQLPGSVQEALGSPLILAIPIALGMTVAGIIIAFLIWSMGGI